MQDAPQTLESRMVVIAASFKTIDWCFEVSRLIFGWRRFEWVQVYNPLQGEIYTYSHVLGHEHPYFYVTSIS